MRHYGHVMLYGALRKVALDVTLHFKIFQISLDDLDGYNTTFSMSNYCTFEDMLFSFECHYVSFFYLSCRSIIPQSTFAFCCARGLDYASHL